MRRTYVDGRGCGLVVKKSFEESYKKWNNNDKVYLQVAGKSWTVNCDMKCNVCRLRSGWDRFAKDNSLTAGDVCVFQLIDASKKILEVVIFRATKETHGDGGSATEESKSKVLHFASAEDFKSQNPFFALALKESYVDGKGRGMVVRKAFEKTYQMWKNDDQVILQFEGKTWPVYCDINRNGCSLRRGWDRFVRDNLLTVGDACVFEPIASEKLLQVFIFRAAKETNSKENNVPRRVKIEAKEARVLTSDNAFTSTYPFFRVKVYPSSLSGPNLSLPKIFVKRYITMDSCMVTLQISDGREWLVKCTYYKSRPKFSVGWNIFAQANHLAAGDICTFKLIDFSTKLLQVFISRAAKETKRGFVAQHAVCLMHSESKKI
ncbi:B3 domain-containing protein LOC_Os12g40080-like isoform X3 [Apium graveolens]|uniref:B3 domain-containing protein LOC_Os12g40080-like isoform X3 n=1 Tax=Apium graveolens TaxID=4045 RepID=UPI003D798805